MAPRSPETRAKIAATLTGHAVSEETRAKLSRAHIGRAMPDEQRAAMTGRALSAEHRQAISAAMGGARSYSGMHSKMRRELPAVCALADATCAGRLEVALNHAACNVETLPQNAQGRPYSTEASHYRRLCHSHHVRCDRYGLE